MQLKKMCAALLASLVILHTHASEKSSISQVRNSKLKKQKETNRSLARIYKWQEQQERDEEYGEHQFAAARTLTQRKAKKY
ncbi:MAG: hypothetical protein AB7F19_05595 [Candidatus Babeliales bacterium]